MEIISQSPNKITLKAPAKVNLTLEIIRKRPDGFHEFRSILTTIPLADTVTLSIIKTAAARRPKIQISCDHPEIPLGAKNHSYRIARFLLQKFKDQIPGQITLRIKIKKRIPIAAGLGGSSADTAATLIGINQLFKLKLPLKEQQQIFAQFSSEPISLLGGTILMKGRGEHSRSLSPRPLNLPLLLLLSPQKAPTRQVFKKFKALLNPASKINYSQKIIRLLESNQKTPAHLGPLLTNDLEASPALNQKFLKTAKNKLKEHGALGASMSGSGATIYGIYPSNYTLAKAKKKLGQEYSLLALAKK